MSWKKNAFSYLMWFVYTLMIGNALMGLAGLLSEEAGLAVYWGILFAALYAAIVAGVVFFVRRAVTKASSFLDRNRTLFLVLEASWAVAFLALGLALRVRGIDGAGQSGEYYEAAKVAMGQNIPQIAHGAVYFYILLLHGVLALFGNHFAAGVWLQIVLQMAAFVLLFFTVRKLAGGIAALVMLGFGMCAPYMVESALTLSPEMLFFFLLSAVLTLMAGVKTDRLNPVLSFFTGVPAALCCYLDVGGLLLLFLAVGFVFCLRREETDGGRKAAAVLLCLAGAGVGFFCCVALDALFCGEPFWDVAGIWFYLYRPKGFLLPATVGAVDSGLQGAFLTGLMAFGIFSFWCDRKRERTAVCTLAAGCVMLAGTLGIFTTEMPGYFMLYLLFAVLAGLGVGQCFYGTEPAEGVADSPETLDGMADLPGTMFLPAASEGAAGLPGLADGASYVPGASEGAADLSGFADEAPGTAEAVKLQAVRAGEAWERQESPAAGIQAALEGRNGAVQMRAEEQKDAPGGDVASASAAEGQAVRTVKYIENPLPLPKKHVRRVLDFPQNFETESGEFDYDVSDDDDFDIK